MIRVNSEALSAMNFEHLCTERDHAVLEDTRLTNSVARSAGTTEWQARCDGLVLSLAWDWAQLSDGALCAMRSVEPRSNVKLIDEFGYDICGVDATAMVWKRIDAIDWQQCAAPTLVML